jgi:hypothetical protein
MKSDSPDCDQWLLDPEEQAKLDRALKRAKTEPYRETELDELEKKILDERWLLDPEVQADLDEAIAWAERNPPRTTDLRELEEMLGLDSADD